eukprot:CAMPEP_0194600198 /NCGR_PEP_ID=MMETSP0292-20121207/28183_1 /TAXON_ID=39354 /ORGANISM="Heterosigma akashiwo, Strain CCMP2393" /LENGTH=80 /DNA_ID=CAMNT_0039461747 /DNA_START=77 /DNA_END=319 /DNA_ORIENTATION=+
MTASPHRIASTVHRPQRRRAQGVGRSAGKHRPHDREGRQRRLPSILESERLCKLVGGCQCLPHAQPADMQPRILQASSHV